MCPPRVDAWTKACALCNAHECVFAGHAAGRLIAADACAELPLCLPLSYDEVDPLAEDVEDKLIAADSVA
jgi:hypothetical protein